MSIMPKIWCAWHFGFSCLYNTVGEEKNYFWPNNKFATHKDPMSCKKVNLWQNFQSAEQHQHNQEIGELHVDWFIAKRNSFVVSAVNG